MAKVNIELSVESKAIDRTNMKYLAQSIIEYLWESDFLDAWIEENVPEDEQTGCFNDTIYFGD